MFLQAITRLPAQSLSAGITTANLGTPDYEKALDQHRLYEETLTQLGLKVKQLPAEEKFPDGHFVEDTAVVFPEVAVITRPGAPARSGVRKKGTATWRVVLWYGLRYNGWCHAMTSRTTDPPPDPREDWSTLCSTSPAPSVVHPSTSTTTSWP